MTVVTLRSPRLVVIKLCSPQWHAWVKHYRQIGNTHRADFMVWHADNTRRPPSDAGWTEATEWPPNPTVDANRC
jgi:hypothetical protein